MTTLIYISDGFKKSAIGWRIGDSGANKMSIIGEGSFIEAQRFYEADYRNGWRRIFDGTG